MNTMKITRGFSVRAILSLSLVFALCLAFTLPLPIPSPLWGEGKGEGELSPALRGFAIPLAYADQDTRLEGNVAIGTDTAGGNKLKVQGTAYITGNLTVDGTMYVVTLDAHTVSGNLTLTGHLYLGSGTGETNIYNIDQIVGYNDIRFNPANTGIKGRWDTTGLRIGDDGAASNTLDVNGTANISSNLTVSGNVTSAGLIQASYTGTSAVGKGISLYEPASGRYRIYFGNTTTGPEGLAEPANHSGTYKTVFYNQSWDWVWEQSNGSTVSETMYLTSSGNLIVPSGDMRAPIFYDQNNTGYYLDPASTSNVNNLTVNGTFIAPGIKTLETTRTIGGVSGNTVAIGYFSNDGTGKHIKINLEAHHSGVIDVHTYNLNEVAYTGSTTNWLELPLNDNGVSYQGRKGYAVDVYRQNIASTGDPLYVRIRNTGTGPGGGSIKLEIEYDNDVTFTSLTSTSTTATAFNASTAPAGGAVDGMYGMLEWSFPVTNGNGWNVSQGGLFVRNSGKVGIGTTGPADNLHIKSGDIRLQAANQTSGDFSETRSIRFTQETDVEVAKIMYSRPSWGNAPADLSFWTRDVDDGVVYERMRIKEGGNVGIGKSNPLTKLDVKGELRVSNTAGEGGDYDNYPVRILSYYSGNAMKMYGNSGKEIMGVYNYDKLTLGQGYGSVGVGTTAPSGKLDVLAGAARSGTHGTTPSFYVSGTLNPGQTGPAANNIEFRHDNGTQGIGFGYNTIYQTGSNANQELNLLSRGTSPITLNAYGYSTGNVGIGISNPNELLHVSKSQNTDTVLKLENLNNGGTSAYAELLVGAIAATVKLQAISNAYVTADLADYIRLLADSNSTGLIIQSKGGAGGIQFWPANSDTRSVGEKMRITPTGEVGIGTTGPTSGYKLDVRGDILAYYANVVGQGLKSGYGISEQRLGPDGGSKPIIFYTGSGFSNEVVRFTTSGNVGIGTTSPREKLDVNGAIMYKAGRHDNLVQDPQFSQDTTWWSRSGNVTYVFQDLPDGTKVRAARTVTAGVGTTAETFTQVARIKIDPKKTYRISVWMKGEGGGTGGTKYLGINTYNSGGGEVGVIGTNGVSYTNPYLHCGALPGNDTWYKYVGYLFGSDTPTGWTNPPDSNGNGCNIGGPNAKFDATADTLLIRFYNYSYDVGQQIVLFALPTIEEVSTEQNVVAVNNNVVLAANSGNVGIGTTGPGQKLDVNGTVAWSGGNSSHLGTGANVTTYVGNSSVNNALVRSNNNNNDAWVMNWGDSAAWGIYNRNIDSNLVVGGALTVPANSTAFIGGGLAKAYIEHGSGTAGFAGTVTAPTFSGALSGNATTATTATTATNNVLKSGDSMTGSLWLNSGNDVTSLNGILTLYSTGNATTSQMMFKNTTGLGYGNHGAITGTYNTYFVMDTSNRGWIFRDATAGTNIASISNTGVITANSNMQAGNLRLWNSDPGNVPGIYTNGAATYINSVSGDWVTAAYARGNGLLVGGNGGNGQLYVTGGNNPRISVGSSSTDGMLFDSTGNYRPALTIRGAYPHLELWHDGANANHGATIRFGGYDNGSSGAFKHWVIGTPGSELYFMDIGYDAGATNPHEGISGYNGTTIMRLTNSGYVGIGNFGTYGSLGDTTPDFPLDVRGTGRFTGKLSLDAAEGLGVYGMRGRNTNEQIEMYQKVSIGYPSGWGAFPQAPTQGLYTYGGAVLAGNNGNVGIGTTAPGAKLEVSHTANASPTTGTVVLSHPSNYQRNSIVFPSRVNYGSDYGYIEYRDDDNDSGEAAILTVGTSNDGDDDVYLDPTGRLRIDATNITLNTSGTLIVTGDARAPIFYDSNNTSYYVDPAAGLSANFAGYVDATYFRDENDTTYYVDPNSVSNLRYIPHLGPNSNNPEKGRWNPLWTAVGVGKPVYSDEEFASGSNSVGVYNNAGGDGVVHTRQADAGAPNSSGYVIKISNNGNATSPGYGGFVQTISARRNTTFVQRFRAKLDSGRTLNIAENQQGSNNTSYWLTSNAGTGKWEEYIRVSHCGNTGTFSGGGHVYVSGGTSIFDWYLASCNTYEVEQPLANTYWNAANDGAGSGLDADTVDGQSLGTGDSPTFNNLYLNGVVPKIQGYSPANNAIRMTPNFHLNAPAGYAVILNWDNGSSGTNQQLRIGNGASSDVFWVRANGETYVAGNVGIGITNPTYKLHVSGTANVTGAMTVGGYLTKSGGGFTIDHPLDPANKVLTHSFVESPDMKNLYDGMVVLDEKGESTIELPDWFEALNRDFRYNLTPIGSPAMLFIKDEIRDNRFVIAGGEPGMKVSWQVTGTRKDAWAEKNRPKVEEEKGSRDGLVDKGEYIAKECFE